MTLLFPKKGWPRGLVSQRARDSLSDGFLVSSSLRSPSSDTARQESHQPASPASRLRGRLHSDRYKTTRSPLARGLLPGGAWPRGRQRAAALSFPYSAFVLSADRSSRQARSGGNRIFAASEPSGLKDLRGRTSGELIAYWAEREAVTPRFATQLAGSSSRSSAGSAAVARQSRSTRNDWPAALT
jgi:hypothetical protein